MQYLNENLAKTGNAVIYLDTVDKNGVTRVTITNFKATNPVDSAHIEASYLYALPKRHESQHYGGFFTSLHLAEMIKQEIHFHMDIGKETGPSWQTKWQQVVTLPLLYNDETGIITAVYLFTFLYGPALEHRHTVAVLLDQTAYTYNKGLVGIDSDDDCLTDVNDIFSYTDKPGYENSILAFDHNAKMHSTDWDKLTYLNKEELKRLKEQREAALVFNSQDADELDNILSAANEVIKPSSLSYKGILPYTVDYKHYELLQDMDLSYEYDNNDFWNAPHIVDLSNAIIDTTIDFERKLLIGLTDQIHLLKTGLGYNYKQAWRHLKQRILSDSTYEPDTGIYMTCSEFIEVVDNTGESFLDFLSQPVIDRNNTDSDTYNYGHIRLILDLYDFFENGAEVLERLQRVGSMYYMNLHDLLNTDYAIQDKYDIQCGYERLFWVELVEGFAPFYKKQILLEELNILQLDIRQIQDHYPEGFQTKEKGSVEIGAYKSKHKFNSGETGVDHILRKELRLGSRRALENYIDDLQKYT